MVDGGVRAFGMRQAGSASETCTVVIEVTACGITYSPPLHDVPKLLPHRNCLQDVVVRSSIGTVHALELISESYHATSYKEQRNL